MLKITLYAIGKLKEKFWKDACNEYLKRLGAYLKITIVELTDSTIDKEEKLLLAKLDNKTNPIILLDQKGKEITSKEFACLLDEFKLSGVSQLIFIIGGSVGVTKAIKDISTLKLSFGKITLPHNIARVVLLEQIYRACKISKSEPYHK